MRLPKLFNGCRRRLFVMLVLNGLLQAALGLAAVVSFDRFVASGFSEPSRVGIIALLAGGLYVSRILQRRHGEMFALDYINETRRVLLEKIFSLPDNSRNVRLGLVTVRLSSDLLSVKTWLAEGFAVSIAMGTALLMLMAGAAFLYPAVAIILACVVVPWTIAIFILRPYLKNAIGIVRKLRGRLAALAGDHVVGRLTLAHFGKTRPALDSMSRQGQSLSAALVRRATISEALRAAPVWALPIASLVGLFVLSTGNASPTLGATPLLLLLGMSGAILTGLSRSIDLHLAKTLAITRLSSTLASQGVEQAASATFPAVERGAPIDLTITLGDPAGKVRRYDITPGSVLSLVGGYQERRSGVLAAMARLRDDPDIATAIGGVSASEIPIRDWRRLITLSSPRLPLIPGTIRKNISIGAPSSSTDEEVLEIARRLGIAGKPSELDVDIEQSLLPVTVTVALRLCRSLIRRTPVVLLDETITMADQPMLQEFIAVALERRTTIITSGCVMGADGKPIGEPIAISSGQGSERGLATVGCSDLD